MFCKITESYTDKEKAKKLNIVKRNDRGKKNGRMKKCH